MIDALDQFPCSPSAFGVRLTASAKGFSRFSGNSSRRRVEPYIVSGAARPRTRPPSRQRDPARAGAQRSKKALRKGNDGRQSRPKRLLRLPAIIGPCASTCHGRCAPQICSRHRQEQGYSAPRDQLVLLWKTKLPAARSSPPPVLVGSMATPFLYRFPVRRPLPRHSTNRAGS